MKIYIHIVSQGGKGAEEAAENRNYLGQRMTDEINEIIRVLQLTSYDEEQSDLDNLTVLKKLQNAIANKMNAANDWLLVGFEEFKYRYFIVTTNFFRIQMLLEVELAKSL